MRGDVDEYVTSATFTTDLGAARRMWSGNGVMEAAGSLVLLTYFAIPGLLAVGPAGGSLRTAVDGHRERDFLAAMLGLADRFPRGLADPGVRTRARSLGEGHRGFPGMQSEQMDFIAGLLALAPHRLGAQECQEYWRYMGHLAALWGCDLAPMAETLTMCERFAADHSGPSEAGTELVAAFGVRHPEHVSRAVPSLFPPVRRVVRAVLG